MQCSSHELRSLTLAARRRLERRDGWTLVTRIADNRCVSPLNTQAAAPMATHHAQSGEVVDVGPLGASLREHMTRALIKTKDLEVLWVVMPEGKELPTHRAPGPITVHCLEGRVAFTAMRGTVDLEPGQLLYLEADEPHALLAHDDSSLLVTLVLPHG